MTTDPNSLTTRDLTTEVAELTESVEQDMDKMRKQCARILELQELLEKTKDDIRDLQSEGTDMLAKIKKEKRALKRMKKELDARALTTAKELYVDRCKKFLLDNAELAVDRVCDTDFVENLGVNTSSFSMPEGTIAEKKEFLETLSDNNIIAFAQLLHLCKSFDEAELDSVNSDGFTPEKLNEVEIYNNFGTIHIYLSEEYDCNNEQEYECCNKHYAYTFDIHVRSLLHFVTYNNNFSIDSNLTPTYGCV